MGCGSTQDLIHGGGKAIWLNLMKNSLEVSYKFKCTLTSHFTADLPKKNENTLPCNRNTVHKYS